MIGLVERVVEEDDEAVACEVLERAAVLRDAPAHRRVIRLHALAGQVGALESGRLADILVIDGDPLADIGVLQDRTRIREIFLGGETVTLEINPKAHRLRSEFSYQMWNEVYSQARIAELERERTRQAAE